MEPATQQAQPDINQRWIQHQRRQLNKVVSKWFCVHCPDRIFPTTDSLWKHALQTHQDIIPTDLVEIEFFRTEYLLESTRKRPAKDDPSIQKEIEDGALGSRNKLPAWALELHGPPSRSPPEESTPFDCSTLPANIDEDTIMQDGMREDNIETPRRRAVVGDAMSVRSEMSSQHRETSPPRRSKGRPTSNPRAVLWSSKDEPIGSSIIDLSNIASVQAQKARAQALQGAAKHFPPTHNQLKQSTTARNPRSSLGKDISKTSRFQSSQDHERDSEYDIIMRPETRPISQEQLVAEVKGIYAGLVMVEAKCIGMDRLSVQAEKRDQLSTQAEEILSYIARTTSKLGAKARSRRPSNRRKALRIRIKDMDHLACPDSGSEENIMSEDFATTHDLLIRRRPRDKKRFELGSGKNVWSIGRVRVPVELRHSLTRKKRCFYILPSCPVPLILGMPFLHETEVLSKNRHLLEECTAEMSDISSLLWIGSPRQQMSCSLDGHELIAHADTGSDLNLISLKCAKREGFAIDRRREARRRIRVGDGSETETIGQVLVYNLSLDWRKSETPIFDMDFDNNNYQPSDSKESAVEDLGSERKPCGVIFHVLPNLPCDLIFGRNLLEQTDAFTLCPSLSSNSFPHVEEGGSHRAFHVLISLGPLSLNIPISRRKRRGTAIHVNEKEKHDDERHGEMYRRSTMEDKISAMPVEERGIAAVREARKARAWDELHMTCIHCHPA